MSKFLPLFTFLFFLNNLLHGASGVGGTLTYTSLGNDRYLLTAHCFRDCKGTALNSPVFGYFAGSNFGKNCNSDTLGGWTRISINQITTVCKSTTNPCSPANTAAGAGYEDHIYQKIVDLSATRFSSSYRSTSCGDISFYFNICCRSGAITTGSAGEDSYVTCTIRTGNLAACKNAYNSSSVPHNFFHTWVCCSAPVFYNPAFADSTDYDSISFALAPAISSLPNTSVTYGTSFSAKYPLSVYCPGSPGSNTCTPSASVDPPRGITFSAKTADMVFTPTNCSEIAVIAIEALEWRRDTAGNWVNIGRVLYDFMMIVVDDNCGYNKSPKITGNTNQKVCAGDKICFNIDIEDPVYIPFQTSPDTLAVSWVNPLRNSTIQVFSDSIPHKDKLEFCWQTSDSDALEYARHFTILAHDGRCQKPAKTSRAFSIFVQKKDSAWMEISGPLACNTINLKGKTSGSSISTPSFDWTVSDSISGKIIYKGTKTIEDLSYLPQGVYKISMIARSSRFCYKEVVQFLHIPNPPPTVSLVTDTIACAAENVEVRVIILNATAPYSYSWKINDSLDASAKDSILLFKNISENKSILLEVTDANACKISAVTNIKINALPKVTWQNSPVSMDVCYTKKDTLINNLVLEPASGLRNTTNFRIWGSNQKFGSYGLVDSIAADSHLFRMSKINNAIDLSGGKFVEDQLYVWYRDSNGCENTAGTKIRVNGTPIIELLDRTYCQNTLGEITADSFVLKPKPQFGHQWEWSVLSYPLGVDPAGILQLRNFTEYYFQGGSKSLNQFSGEYILQLRILNVITGCRDSAAVKIMLLPQPMMLLNTHSGICINSGTVDLTTLFNADGKKVTVSESTFEIVALNGDTNAVLWKNVQLRNGYLFPSSAGWGKWTVLCKNNSTGCYASAENNVFINPKPTALFVTSPTDSAEKDFPYFLVDNQSSVASGENMTYEWYFRYPSLADKSVAVKPFIAYPLVDSTYRARMIVTTSSGCKDTFEKTLVVGNGSLIGVHYVNDSRIHLDKNLKVSGIEFRETELRVYDASGRLVAGSRNNEGIDIAPGIYLYQIRITLPDNTVVNLSGRSVLSNE